MKCNKCKFETDDKKKMIGHLENKHKIEGAKYILDDLKENRFIMELKDLHYKEAEKIKDKLMKCEFCHREGFKEDISKKEIEKILIIKANTSSFDKTKMGHFGDGTTSPKWVCPKCEKEHSIEIKYWKLKNDIKDMFSKIQDEAYNKGKELLKKSIFSNYEWEEYGIEITYNKTINKKRHSFILSVCGEESDFYSYNKDWEKLLTQENIKIIKDSAVKFYNDLLEQNSKIYRKYEDEMGVIEVDQDEGYITYRDDKHGVLVTVDSSLECDDEESIEEIRYSDTVNLGEGYMVEIFITNKRNIYEYIWKIKKDEFNKNVKEKLITSRRLDFYCNEHFEIFQEQKTYANHLRRLMTNELYEANVKFANKEFKFFIVHSINLNEKDSYCFQWRKDMYFEPFSEPIKLDSYQLVQLIKCFDTLSYWIKESYKEKTLVGKITKVGSNSKHIIFDKLEGLSLFYGKDLYIPDWDDDVKVKYTHHKIEITPVKSDEREKFNLS